MAQGELDLATIMLLDKVQKGQRIAAEDAKRLKTAKLVEGRYPNLLVAGSVAAVAGQKPSTSATGVLTVSITAT